MSVWIVYMCVNVRRVYIVWEFVRINCVYVCFCSWGLRLKQVGYSKMEIIWIAISLSRGDETITP